LTFYLLSRLDFWVGNYFFVFSFWKLARLWTTPLAY
jgi:hypothetical protein